MCFDEARFGRITGLRRCWAPFGLRPVIGAQIIREYVYVYGAVDPHTGITFFMILPFVDTACMNIYLHELSNQHSDYHIILLADQASWHKTDELNIPDNITFLFIPPHSPELNPAEHLWDYMREHDMANKSYDSLDTLEDTLLDRLKTYSSQKEIFQSLCGFPWLLVKL